jgi:hypothetical protein
LLYVNTSFHGLGYFMQQGLSTEQLQKYGTTALVGATVVVGAAIEIDGAAGRALNGAGGIIWFASAGVLAWAASKTAEPPRQWVIAVGLTAVVAFVAKPTDLAYAVSGLGIAGAVMASTAASRPILWATLIPAIYLPMHIGTAILKAIGRSILGMESSIRSEPPPTAAIVPFAMVVAAIAGGWLVSKFRRNRGSAGTIETASGR